MSAVQSTLGVRSTANPRRTTLAHLESADALAPRVEPRAAEGELPSQTANPRRVILEEMPAG